MESAALTPPAWLEKAVLALIPPAAREVVGGDLYETYRTPRQYAVEALRTIPFVIASLARRNLDPPVLALQGALIVFYLSALAPRAAVMLAPTLLLLLALREAYRAQARPSSRSAIRNSALVGTVLVLFLESLSLGMAVGMGVPDRVSWLELFAFGPMLLPLLCVLSTGLVLNGDRDSPFAAGAAAGALSDDFRHFMRRARVRALLDGAVTLLLACLLFRLASPALAWVYVLAAIYLSLPPAAGGLPSDADFLSVRLLYRCELARHRRKSRFLRWLWFAPLLVSLRQVVRTGLESPRPVLAVTGVVAIATVCFVIAALEREFGGRTQEKIVALERMREGAPRNSRAGHLA